MCRIRAQVDDFLVKKKLIKFKKKKKQQVKVPLEPKKAKLDAMRAAYEEILSDPSFLR